MGATRPRDAGLKAIIAYKFARAAGSAVAAIVLGVLTAVGVSAAADQFVTNLHEHAVHRVSLEISELLVRALEPKHVLVAIIGLALDAVVVFFEGWSLHKRWWWGPWLVVAATSGLLPFELVSLAHRTSLPRALVLALNLIIVAYLVNRAVREHRARAST